MAAALAVVVYAGCGAPEPVAEPPALTPDTPLPPPVELARNAPLVPAAEGSVPVVVAYSGVGNLHQSFFNTQELVEAVSAGLGGCVDDTAEVVVSYNSETRVGTIVLHTVGTQLRCRPEPTSAGFDLTPLVPIAQTLAAYRDGVANRFDLRIGSFKAGVRVLRGTQVCDVWLGGQYPPDGSTFSPCVSLQGHEVCTHGNKRDGLTELVVDAGVARDQLRRCFAP
jgi:hypothetical protein